MKRNKYFYRFTVNFIKENEIKLSSELELTGILQKATFICEFLQYTKIVIKNRLEGYL